MAQPIWNTPAGTLGTFPSLVVTNIQLIATPVLPATSLTYKLISGSLPPGMTASANGIISGTPLLVTTDTTDVFTVRVTDNLGNIRDRTFSISITGAATPEFITPAGSLLTELDSTWIELPIQISNPDSNNQILVSVAGGSLPPGLEINDRGLIRGYAEPPTNSFTLPAVTTTVTGTNSSDNSLSCLSTSGFIVGRPIIFTGSMFGGLVQNTVYYIKTILSSTKFTISVTQFGDQYLLTNGAGTFTASLPVTSTGEPTIRTYSFSLKIESKLGGDIENYSITIINQNNPGNPGKLPNTRTPTIYNTRPPTFNINGNDPYYGYYVLLPDGATYDPLSYAFIGTIQSDNFFAFKIIGHDFDGASLSYTFANLPLGLYGDSNTGWITGTPIIESNSLNNYNFSVSVSKQNNSSIQSQYFNFSFNVSNNINGDVTWVTPSNLGTLFNGETSVKKVLAISDVELNYRLVAGTLPPNLTLLSNGEIAGNLALESSQELLPLGTTIEYTFTIQAYSPLYPIITSNKTFTIAAFQKYSQPTDILYIKAAPDISDRNILETLLTNTEIIPDDYLYRKEDQNFGKANNVIYVHAYGIYASDLEEYLAAVTRNHYWRNITLGEIETAVAKDENGKIIYEVVYSKVIDNLVNPQGISINSTIFWPRPIDLSLGPWYTSVTDTYTSFVDIFDQQYYTSLTPGYARVLYPNSLFNMRNRVADVLGQEYSSDLLPLWMTSQQANGSTLGYTQAWVICYTKPGYAETVKNNINNSWPYKLNQINFTIDRFSVDKSMTYNYDNNTVPPAWTGLPSATPVPNPKDSKDFYVLFPQKTILPNKTQY